MERKRTDLGTFQIREMKINRAINPKKGETTVNVLSDTFENSNYYKSLKK